MARSGLLVFWFSGFLWPAPLFWIAYLSCGSLALYGLLLHSGSLVSSGMLPDLGSLLANGLLGKFGSLIFRGFLLSSGSLVRLWVSVLPLARSICRGFFVFVASKGFAMPVGPRLVVAHLGYYGRADVQAPSSTEVEDSDEAVGKLFLDLCKRGDLIAQAGFS